MGLNRTALRLATVMALANGFQAPWPTMARGRVFDSRMDPVQIVDLSEVMPIITVCTDDDTGTSLSQNNGGPPFEQSVSLVIEASIGMLGEVEDGTAGDIVLPETEPELEAMLDLLEDQIKLCLIHPTRRWSVEVQKHARRITSWNSQRFVEANGNVRMAARKMTATVYLQLDLVDVVPLDETPPATPSVPAPLGPLLDAIVASGSPFATSAQEMIDLLIGAGAHAPVTLPALSGIRLRRAHDIATNTAGTPKGPAPDGSAHVDTQT
jgi:hypothetical protein